MSFDQFFDAFPNSSLIQSPFLTYTTLYHFFLKPIKSNLCYPNILAFVAFHGSVYSTYEDYTIIEN